MLVSSRRRALITLVFGVCSVLAPWPGSAQQPTGLTLTGVVVDATSGTPVPGAFLSLGERGPRAIADSLGAFRLRDVPRGAHVLSVQRFGYVDLEVPVTVDAPPAPLRLALRPDPVVLEGVSMPGAMRRVDVAGTVHDEQTGEPVPWVSLLLTPNAVEETSRASTDRDGVFRMDDVPTGSYFLRLQALGYESRYEMVDVAAPPSPIDLQLRPDSVMRAGVARFSSLLRSRRNYALGIVRAYGQDRLHYTAAPSVGQFLELETPLMLVRCVPASQAIGSDCVVARGDIVEPSVFIDEIPIMAGLEVLRSYSPTELYLIEVYGGGSQIRAYTYDFIEKMARRPRALLPP